MTGPAQPQPNSAPSPDPGVVAAAAGAGPAGGIIAGMTGLANSAANGGFAVDHATADEMLAAVRELRDYLDSNMNDLRWLKQPPPLSSTQTALWASNIWAQTGGNPADGFVTQLEALWKALPETERALTEAKKRYQQDDDASAAGFKPA